MTGKNALPQGDRNVNLDLIRCVAVISVLSVHSFLWVPFTNELFVGKYMWLLTVVRTFFTMCVPLFAMLTGYLCLNKKLSAAYFKKLLPILLTYLLASAATILLRRAWGEDFRAWDALLYILNMEGGAVPYSWYVEMYVGLFLLIPFLNAAYQGMETKGNKQILILVLLSLTTLPSLLNIHNFSTLETLIQPGPPEMLHAVYPDWWSFLWPLDFYFIGAYLREYDFPLSKGKNLALLCLSLVLAGSFLFYRSYGTQSFYDLGGDYGSFDKLFHSVLAFLLMLHLDLSWIPAWLSRLLARISKLSLGIYLCSYASDIYVYSKLMALVQTTRQKQMLMPLAVLLSFLLASLGAQLIQWILEIPNFLKKRSR